ncbi:MAG: hypothetical protein CMM26_05560 [Rhodospirillaceae bacterium]|nr:hypothetical protein [Rhodospirillaceae bacterium]
MKRDELKNHFMLQVQLRELCDAAGIERPLSKREVQIGLLALQADAIIKDDEASDVDLGLSI